MGLTVAAAVAISGAPGLGMATGQRAMPPTGGPSYQTVAHVGPVNVSLLSGADAINWQGLDITSTASGHGDGRQDGQEPDAFPEQGAGSGAMGSQPHGTGTLVGQSVGVLGALPGNIQLMHPVTSRHITSPYGWRNNPTGAGSQIHIGQDYAIACGSPVYASADGVVIQSAWAGHSGMRVTIEHGSSVRTGYSHNSRLMAKVGDSVKQGQLIALSGTTGNSTGCHVHFEVIINGRWNDPRNFLPPISGQPNPMIDSRRTTIAAEPIRNAGAPRNPAADAGNVPERSATGTTSRSASPPPVIHRAPVAAPRSALQPSQQAKPRATPKVTPKPEAPAKPKPSVKPKPQAKPAPSPKATPPTSVPPKATPPTSVPPKAPSPVPTTETPGKPPTSKTPPTTPPASEAPATDATEPGKTTQPVANVPLAEIPLPEADAGETSNDPTPKQKTEPSPLVPQEEVHVKQSTKPELGTVHKAPAGEQPPARHKPKDATPVPVPAKPKAAVQASPKAEDRAPEERAEPPAPVKRAPKAPGNGPVAESEPVAAVDPDTGK